MALTPALIKTSGPSGKGKKPSEAAAVFFALFPDLKIANSQHLFLSCCPTPDEIKVSPLTKTIAFDLEALQIFQAKRRSWICFLVGFFLVLISKSSAVIFFRSGS